MKHIRHIRTIKGIKECVSNFLLFLRDEKRSFTTLISRRTIENNPDVIKAISYINCNWKSHVMWDEVHFFNGLDVRMQLDPELSKKWKAKMAETRYVNI